MATYTWNTTSTWPTYVGAGGIATRPSPPLGRVESQAVRAKAGWLGQLILEGEIVWESKAYKEREKALEVARAHGLERVRKLFA